MILYCSTTLPSKVPLVVEACAVLIGRVDWTSSGRRLTIEPEGEETLDFTSRRVAAKELRKGCFRTLRDCAISNRSLLVATGG